jgi:outer membrane protein, multidrug efflux system
MKQGSQARKAQRLGDAAAPCCLPGVLPGVLLCVLLSGLVSACVATPPVAPSQGVVTPLAFKAAALSAQPQPAALPAATLADWWQSFADPVLNDLVQRAGQHNTQIEAARARWAQAQALLHADLAVRGPQLGFNTSWGRQGGPLLNAAGGSGGLVTAAINVSQNLDLLAPLGLGARAGEAAGLDAQARQALLDHTRLQIQAELAQAYFSLRAVDLEKALLGASLQAWQATWRLTQQRWQAGAVAQTQLLQVQAEVAASHMEAAALDRRRAELEHGLALLVGEAASSFKLATSDAVAGAPSLSGLSGLSGSAGTSSMYSTYSTSSLSSPSLPPNPFAMPQVPAGLPSHLLQRRPDVAAAQRTWLAAQARVRQARVAWFPQLVLTVSGGQASSHLGELLRASTRAWGLTALLSLPLWDAGRRDAAIEQADAVLQADAAQYQAQLLGAFKDVEDQLVALHALRLQATQQDVVVTGAARSLVLVQSRQKNGLASSLQVLDAERAQHRARRGLLQTQAAQALATVGLMRALGGAWGGDEIDATATHPVTTANPSNASDDANAANAVNAVQAKATVSAPQ